MTDIAKFAGAMGTLRECADDICDGYSGLSGRITAAANALDEAFGEMRAEVEALRAALTRVSVEYDASIGKIVCWCCQRDWNYTGPTDHAPDCLAAPKEGER